MKPRRGGCDPQALLESRREKDLAFHFMNPLALVLAGTIRRNSGVSKRLGRIRISKDGQVDYGFVTSPRVNPISDGPIETRNTKGRTRSVCSLGRPVENLHLRVLWIRTRDSSFRQEHTRIVRCPYAMRFGEYVWNANSGVHGESHGYVTRFVDELADERAPLVEVVVSGASTRPKDQTGSNN